MDTKQLLDEATSLPVEERALLVDSLLKSLNQPKTELDDQWTEEARKRLAEIRSGSATPIAGDDVFRNLWTRLRG
ncbi:addiction module protein [Guyparkeria sp. SCN-R1]|uniref:addiction module protein n=1 Tax=Guyparkeria sp. SCN-R1 TaxID=2341113 RepID=UPI000F646ECB|nr:addiction module protein [Guyparkeria sp. SCN-R1]RRQ20186.1 addiction module protein [Guyparkeria sp. SCN-R1]